MKYKKMYLSLDKTGMSGAGGRGWGDASHPPHFQIVTNTTFLLIIDLSADSSVFGANCF